MNTNYKMVFWIACLSLPAWASNPARVDSTLKKANDYQEIVLDSIEIVGRVEKPGVIILPKRVEPQIQEKDLERDFNNELRQGVGEIVEPREDLQRVEPLVSIKKAIEKRRE
jgi:hypothetical protein